MKPPFLLEVLLGRGTENQRWQLQQSVNSLQESLSIASTMSPIYDYRLFCGEGFGYLFLDWIDNPADSENCIPVWKTKDGLQFYPIR